MEDYVRAAGAVVVGEVGGADYGDEGEEVGGCGEGLGC